MRITMRKRLFFSFSIIIILFIFFGAYSLYSVKKIMNKSSEINNIWLLGIDFAHTVSSSTKEFRGKEYKHVIASINNKGSVENDTKEINNVINKSLDNYNKIIVAEKNVQLANEVKDQWEKYLKIHEKVISLSRDGKVREAEELMLGESLQQYNNLSKACDDLVKINKDNAEEAKNISNLTYKKTILMLVIFIVLVSVFALLTAFLIGNNITKRLRILSLLLNKTAQYDIVFDETVYKEINSCKNNDEIADEAKEVLKMRSGLRTLVNSIKGNSKNVALNSKNLSTSIKESLQAIDVVAKSTEYLAQGATSLAENAQNGTERLENLSEEINNVVISSSIMKKLIDETSMANREGLRHIENLKEVIKYNVEVAGKVALQINKLDNESESIGKITDTIKSITGEINLLSLNAAIEAARAGENGRGFAVVADEIRNLAKETAHSTKEIEEIVKSIKNGISTTKSQMTKVEKAIEETSVSSIETEKASQIINTTIINITKQIDVLLEGVKIMDKDKEKVVDVIADISSIIEETAATAEQISASVQEQLASLEQISQSTEDLEKIVDDLEMHMDKFKV